MGRRSISLMANPATKRHIYGAGLELLAALTCNLSLVNGTAFITNPSVDLRPYVGFKITLNDGAQDLVGWIKAAGTGETYGNELLDANAWVNSIADPWETLTVNANGRDIDVAANTLGGYGMATKIISALTVGSLYLWDMNLIYNLGASGTEAYIARTTPWASQYLPTRPYDAGAAKRYITVNYACDLFSFNSYFTPALNLTLTHSFKQSLTPSATGVTIVSTQGGGTYNWVSDGGIDPNAASFTATITRS